MRLQSCVSPGRCALIRQLSTNREAQHLVRRVGLANILPKSKHSATLPGCQCPRHNLAVKLWESIRAAGVDYGWERISVILPK